MIDQAAFVYSITTASPRGISLPSYFARHAALISTRGLF
jgi:hypothetical protein